MDTKDRTIPQIRMRQNELDEIFALFATLQELDSVKSHMKERIAAIPNGYRDIRLVETTLNRILVDLMKTVPVEKLRSIRKMLPKMKYRVYFNGTLGEMVDDGTALATKDLDVLIKVAHDNCCLLCDDNCNTCKYGLNKVFCHVLKVDRQPGESWSFLNLEDES